MIFLPKHKGLTWSQEDEESIDKKVEDSSSMVNDKTMYIIKFDPIRKLIDEYRKRSFDDTSEDDFRSFCIHAMEQAYRNLHSGGSRETVKEFFGLLQYALSDPNIKSKFSREEIDYFERGYIK